jgi:glyoxylase-like metal-dependent hydrolase (beta-lactamase superfamily II)
VIKYRKYFIQKFGEFVMEYTRLENDIYRLVIPYKDIFTTVYLVKYEGGALLFDAATYDSDVDDYILPFLTALGGGDKELTYIFISHNHRDHSGGISRLLHYFPGVEVITCSPDLEEKLFGFNVTVPENGAELAGGIFRVVRIPGHSADSAAILNTCTGVMITGDSLQLYGIFGSQDWGSNIALPAEHIAAVNELRSLDVQRIYTAHDFHPYGFSYIGREAVLKAYDAAIQPLLNMKEVILQNPSMTDAQIREVYNASGKIPPVREGVFRAMRAAILNKKM